MFNQKMIACAIALALPLSAQANDSDELEKLRADIAQMKQNYESRIQSLEARLQQTQATADQADSKAEAASVQASTKSSASNAFNPDVSLILSGTYANRSQDSNYHISGFQAGGEIDPGRRGFDLGESELGIYANVDASFYGGLNLALAADNSVSVEEAFIQTTALPYGATVKAGRFFSGIGYLNEQHAHTWDFVDSPLAYKAFLGNQFAANGVQLKWLAPTDMFMELGAEYGSAGRDKNGGGAGALFGHVGGDVGFSNSWRAGLSYLQESPEARESNDLDITNTYVSNAFTGTSKVWLADFVWKWAPNGNASNTSLKLQAEYMRRRESGDLAVDGQAAAPYSAAQSGWYAQAIYQFMPRWRTGLRYDRLDSGDVNYGLNAAQLAATAYNPQKVSLMFDYSPSEFSRFRLQFSRDQSRQEVTDNQVYLQYQMSLGAHAAHKY